jgi:hypothetical protein
MSAREKAGGGSSDVQNPIDISKILKESIILMEFVITQLNQMCDFNLKQFDENVKTLLTFETLNIEINNWMIETEASIQIPNITIGETQAIQSKIQSVSNIVIGEFDKLIVADESNISDVTRANTNLWYLQACTGERSNIDQPRLDIENSEIIEILRESGNNENYTTFSELANLLNKKMKTANMLKFSYNQLKNVSMIYDLTFDENNSSYILHFINELQTKNNDIWWEMISYPYDHDNKTNIIVVLKQILEPIIKGVSKDTEIFTENYFTDAKYNDFLNKIKRSIYHAEDDSSLTINFKRDTKNQLQHIGEFYPYFGTMFNIRKARLTEEYNYMNGIIHIPLLNRIRPRINIEKAEIIHFVNSYNNIAKAIQDEETDKNKFFSHFFSTSVPTTLFMWRGDRDYIMFAPGELQRMIAKLHNWINDIENSFNKLKINGDINRWKTKSQSYNGYSIFAYYENKIEPIKIDVDETFFSDEEQLKSQLFLKLQDHIRRAEIALQNKNAADAVELSQFQQSLETGDWSYFVKSAKDAGSSLYAGFQQGVAGLKQGATAFKNFFIPTDAEWNEIIQEQIEANKQVINSNVYEIVGIDSEISSLTDTGKDKTTQKKKMKTLEAKKQKLLDENKKLLDENKQMQEFEKNVFLQEEPHVTATNEQTSAFAAPIQQTSAFAAPNLPTATVEKSNAQLTQYRQKKIIPNAGGDLGGFGESKPRMPRNSELLRKTDVQSRPNDSDPSLTSGNLPTGGGSRSNSNAPLGFPQDNYMQVATPSSGSRNQRQQHPAVGGQGMPTGMFAGVNFARSNTPSLLTPENLHAGGVSSNINTGPPSVYSVESMGSQPRRHHRNFGGSKTRKRRHQKKTLRRNPRKLMSLRQKYSRRK